MANTTTSTARTDDGPAASTETTRGTPSVMPLTDIYETDASLVLLVEMPGVGPEAVNVSLDGRALTITGETGNHPPTGYTLTHEEFHPAHFERAFTLADAYDNDKVQAVMNDGVLTLTIAKTPKRQAQTIPVKRG
jgi:HSP20 family molecular chaperone IbpA